MFKNLVKYFFCFSLLLSADQFSIGYAAVRQTGIEQSGIEQVDQQHIATTEIPSFHLIDLTLEVSSRSQSTYFNVSKRNFSTSDCTKQVKSILPGALPLFLISTHYNKPHQNQDSKEPDSFHLV